MMATFCHLALRSGGFTQQVGASDTYTNRFPDIPVARNPENPKPGELPPRPLAFVLNVVLIDLQPLLSKGHQDLVPNGDAGFCVTAA
jgi:hypothetical protein